MKTRFINITAGAILLGVILVLIFVSWKNARAEQPYTGPATLVKVPLSGAAWVPPGQQAQPANLEARLASMEADIKKILKLLEEAAGPDPASAALPPPSQALLDGLGICTQCHVDRVAKQKGDSFVLFITSKDQDGKEQSLFREDFTRRELLNIRREVEEGLMPKKTSGKVLTPDQKAAILNEVKGLLARKDNEGR